MVLNIRFCVAKGITDLESKVVYAGVLAKNRHYWPKVVHGYLTDTHFQER